MKLMILEVRRVLELRQDMSKTSVKKYEAMERAMCKDERIRGLLQYYGANRTGRWAGRLVQVHNLPRNDMADLDLARELLISW
jgi:DNA polymerase